MTRSAPTDHTLTTYNQWGVPMTVDQAHHIEDPNATTPPPQFEVVGSVPTPPVPDPSEAMTVRGTPTDTPAPPSAT